eukprot:SAG25_NODE_357_length_9189_cov_5.378218_6_plen_184_part_00
MRYTDVFVVQKNVYVSASTAPYSQPATVSYVLLGMHASSLDHGSRARQAHARRQQAAAANRGAAGWPIIRSMIVSCDPRWLRAVQPSRRPRGSPRIGHAPACNIYCLRNSDYVWVTPRMPPLSRARQLEPVPWRLVGGMARDVCRPHQEDRPAQGQLYKPCDSKSHNRWRCPPRGPFPQFQQH